MLSVFRYSHHKIKLIIRQENNISVLLQAKLEENNQFFSYGWHFAPKRMQKKKKKEKNRKKKRMNIGGE